MLKRNPALHSFLSDWYQMINIGVWEETYLPTLSEVSTFFYSPKYLHGLCVLRVPSLLRYANCVQLTKEKGPRSNILFRAQMFCSSAFLSTCYMSGSKHGILHYSKSSCTGKKK